MVLLVTRSVNNRNKCRLSTRNYNTLDSVQYEKLNNTHSKIFESHGYIRGFLVNRLRVLPSSLSLQVVILINTLIALDFNNSIFNCSAAAAFFFSSAASFVSSASSISIPVSGKRPYLYVHWSDAEYAPHRAFRAYWGRFWLINTSGFC